MMFLPRRKHAYGPPLSVTGTALHFYMYMTFVPHRRHILPRSVTNSFHFLYLDGVRTPQETQTALSVTETPLPFTQYEEAA
jgi:hypothetical protein